MSTWNRVCWHTNNRCPCSHTTSTFNLLCMEKYDDKLPQIIREVRSLSVGSPDAAAIAHAMRSWQRLAAHLCPLIGEAGFCALYGRAVRLASVNEDWPPIPHGVRSIDILFATLEESLATHPVQACAVNLALLETFTKLLSGLIGEALTARLLNTAWAERPDGKRT